MNPIQQSLDELDLVCTDPDSLFPWEVTSF